MRGIARGHGRSSRSRGSSSTKGARARSRCAGCRPTRHSRAVDLQHLPDKQALENALISAGFEEQAAAFEQALDSPDPLGEIASTYRRFAKEHPHLYRLMTERPLQRDRLTPGAEERAASSVVHATGNDLDAARAAWAFAHGMTILELNGRFPPDADLDAAWQRGLDAFRSGRSRSSA